MVTTILVGSVHIHESFGLVHHGLALFTLVIVLVGLVHHLPYSHFFIIRNFRLVYSHQIGLSNSSVVWSSKKEFTLEIVQ